MKKFKWLNLQLFADGADGGDAAPTEAEGTAIPGEDIPECIPERARDNYRKAVAKSKPSGDTRGKSTVTDMATADEPAHVAYSDLIKSDEYKDEHKAYMDKTIGERLKKYKGMEEKQSKYDEVLSIFAGKYGIDTASETFLDDLQQKAENDDSMYEQYAMEHDISTEEARRVVGLERKVAQAEAMQRAEEMQRQEEERHQQEVERWNRLQKNAEATKAKFPAFNLEAELADERFARMCFVNNDDTTAAYMACHWNEIMNNTIAQVSQQTQLQTANAIASGKSRPMESGLSTNATAVVTQDFSKMNLKQIREYADQQRRMQNNR